MTSSVYFQANSARSVVNLPGLGTAIVRSTPGVVQLPTEEPKPQLAARFETQPPQNLRMNIAADVRRNMKIMARRGRMDPAKFTVQLHLIFKESVDAAFWARSTVSGRAQRQKHSLSLAAAIHSAAELQGGVRVAVSSMEIGVRASVRTGKAWDC